LTKESVKKGQRVKCGLRGKATTTLFWRGKISVVWLMGKKPIFRMLAYERKTNILFFGV